MHLPFPFLAFLRQFPQPFVGWVMATVFPLPLPFSFGWPCRSVKQFNALFSWPLRGFLAFFYSIYAIGDTCSVVNSVESIVRFCHTSASCPALSIVFFWFWAACFAAHKFNVINLAKGVALATKKTLPIWCVRVASTKKTNGIKCGQPGSSREMGFWRGQGVTTFRLGYISYIRIWFKDARNL